MLNGHSPGSLGAVRVSPDEPPREMLRRIATSVGTPTYAYDIARVRSQVMRVCERLPPGVELLYSIKANPSLGLCSLMAKWGLGADVASAGELLVAVESGFAAERIYVNGPYKSPETIASVSSLPNAILSVDSSSELHSMAEMNLAHRVLLRLRPDFRSAGPCGCGADSESRFGIPFEDLAECREVLQSRLRLTGFHVFSGSQLSGTSAVLQHLNGSAELVSRAAELLAVNPEIVNLGGGFGIPYGPGDEEIDLDAIGGALSGIVERVRPARVVLELGRYLVAQAGWYLTTVVARQARKGRPAVVVDGGVHHRADICGLGMFARGAPPLVLGARDEPPTLTDVLGCLCLPNDILLDGGLLPPVRLGDVLAFPNGGAYGLSASPVAFLSHPAPAEVAFDGEEIELLRARAPSRTLLEGQSRLERVGNHPLA